MPFIFNLQGLKGEITVKRGKGTKVKVIFQGLHMTCVILLWFIIYNSIFLMLDLT
jgi:hypothetical protein